jgi:hypothetical protein
MSESNSKKNKRYWAGVPKEERSKRMQKLKADWWKKQDPKARRKFALKLVRARKKNKTDEQN